MKKILLFLLAFCLVLAASCAEAPKEYIAQITAMDTTASIKVYDAKYSSVADECAELLIKLEAELSVTLTGSRVYHLNKNGSVPVTEHLKALVSISNSVSSATNGAFNPCIYPLVKLWGFTVNGENNVPSDEAIREALIGVTTSQLSLDGNNALISNGGQVDFGGIAKGYAADLIRDNLKAAGVEAALVDLGGNIQTVGTKEDGKLWNIAVNNPNGDGYVCILSVGETAVVTSGADSRYFIGNDGNRYHHIIDPKTGYPADSGLLSVTVVCENAAIADALATACFVLGVDDSLAVLEKFDAEAVFVSKDTVSFTKGLENKFTLDKTVEGEYKTVIID